MAKLLVQEGNGAREFELVDLEVAIGRELDNTLRLSDPSISRHHAVIRQMEAGYEIQDLESSNGVLLNGTKVPSARLQDGDRITLGQMQLTFVDPQAGTGHSSPLGTVRMAPEAMAQFRANLTSGSAPAAQAAPASAVPPVQPPQSFSLQPAQPVRVGPAFLLPWLPSIPDPAVPLRGQDDSLVRGDLWTRVLASLIDFSPMLALSLVSWGLTLLAFHAGLGLLLGLGLLVAILRFALFVAYLILLPLCWIHYGATPGKKAMKLRVVPEEDPAGRIDLSAAITRLLGYLVMGIISWVIMAVLMRLVLPNRGMFASPLADLAFTAAMVVSSILPYLMLLGAERKGLEDIFSRSIVIKVDR
jgi:uncharacterized RDD family membrane protein YckC